MTFETKTTMELGDIQTVEFECKKCHKISTWPIAAITQPPISCECGSPHSTYWMSRDGETSKAITHLLELIKRLAVANEPFNLRFGVKGFAASDRASSGKD
jgi:hypothetical protein